MALIYQLYSDKILPAINSSSALGTTANMFSNLYLSGTVTFGQTSTAASLTTASPTFTAYYGSIATALGKPTAWLAVVASGTTYKIPLY